MKKWIRMVAVCAVVLLMGIGTSYAGKGPGTGLITLTDEVIEGLKHMREEEKLAYDVYLAMYEKYNAQIFANIAVSEQRHMDAVLKLLNKYGIDDPVAGKELGVFTDERGFNELYQDLTKSGFLSLEYALNVGAEIEKLDIADLTALLDGVQNIPDIKNVYMNLRDGSYHHLAAFESQLSQ